MSLEGKHGVVVAKAPVKEDRLKSDIRSVLRRSNVLFCVLALKQHFTDCNLRTIKLCVVGFFI